jgi:hypothetical protein
MFHERNINRGAGENRGAQDRAAGYQHVTYLEADKCAMPIGCHSPLEHRERPSMTFTQWEV